MLCSPVFLNTTRWGLAYGGPGAAWRAQIVDEYVATIVAALRLAPGVISSRRCATAASTGLEYIPAAAVAPCLRGQVLFNRPVGSEGGGAINNGQTRLPDFRCAMQAAGPPPTLPATPHPYFGIIDSNAAHHLSLLLAERAFAAVPAGFAKAIVNFDAHSDFSAQVTANSFRCDNWGIFSVRAVAGVYEPNPLAQAYVGFANKAAGGQAPRPPFSNSFVRQSPPAPIGQQILAGANVEAQTTALLRLLRAGNPPGVAVYVTVDRDSMQTSCTDYGDGAYAPAVLQAAVHECLATLRAAGVTLAGFDVCGLPTWAGASAVQPQWRAPEIQAQALADLTFFYGEMVNY